MSPRQGTVDPRMQGDTGKPLGLSFHKRVKTVSCDSPPSPRECGYLLVSQQWPGRFLTYFLISPFLGVICCKSAIHRHQGFLDPGFLPNFTVGLRWLNAVCPLQKPRWSSVPIERVETWPTMVFGGGRLGGDQE